MAVTTLQVQMDFTFATSDEAVEAAYSAVQSLPGVVSVDMAFDDHAMSLLVLTEDPTLTVPTVVYTVTEQLGRFTI